MWLVGKFSVFCIGLMLTLSNIANASPVKRTIVGYSDKFTAYPGETIDFKVSSNSESAYSAELVRVEGGNILDFPNSSALTVVDADFSGSYRPQRQHLLTGSYIDVDSSKKLDGLKSFTLGAYIMPTLKAQPVVKRNSRGYFQPPWEVTGKQTVVSRYDEQTNNGWSLSLDTQGQLQFTVGNGREFFQNITLPHSLTLKQWYYVAVVYDESNAQASLYLFDVPQTPAQRHLAQTHIKTVPVDYEVIHQGPFRVAGTHFGDAKKVKGSLPVRAVFNGRIADVRLAPKALNEAQIRQIMPHKITKTVAKSLLLNLDFSDNQAQQVVTDRAGMDHEARSYNLPERAVAGPQWHFQSRDFRAQPALYNAIHFHDDDLYDANWKTSFSYTVPKNLKSGIYAVRLTQENRHQYISFVVPAKKGRATSAIALWLPEYTYSAYANLAKVPKTWSVSPNRDDQTFLSRNREYVSGGFYNAHTDGSPFTYSSLRRPNLHLAPRALGYHFSADTQIARLLTAFDLEYDIITDAMVHAQGEQLLAQYDAVVTGGHHQYTTLNILHSVEGYLNQGGRLFISGGDSFSRFITPSQHISGVFYARPFSARHEKINPESPALTQVVPENAWFSAVLGSQSKGVAAKGAGFTRVPRATTKHSEFVFWGTNKAGRLSVVGTNVCGMHVNGELAKSPFMADSVSLGVLAKSSQPVSVNQIQGWGGQVDNSGGSQLQWASRQAQCALQFLPTAEGGAIFSTGSSNWMKAASANRMRNDIAQVTRNVLQRFLDPTPFEQVTPVKTYEAKTDTPRVDDNYNPEDFF